MEVAVPVPWMDHRAHYQTIESEIDRAVRRVLESGEYTMDAQVRAFEEEFAAYCGRRHGISVGSGSDAILISLKAFGIGEGDQVISAANSCWSVPLAIAHSGADTVLVDIDEQTYNIDPAGIEEAITPCTRAILAVHGHGIPCHIRPIVEIARRHNLKVIEDGAVATGARYEGQRVGSFGHLAVFSFGHVKMLTSPGNNAGMIVTDSRPLASKARMLADYGSRAQRESDGVPQEYSQTGKVCAELGYNSTLDALQAAILRVKLKGLDAWLEQRRVRANLYEELLADLPVVTPLVPDYIEPVYRGYLIRVPKRDSVFAELRSRGIGVELLYLPPVHLQPAFRQLGYRQGDFPVTERVAREMISLPLYPELNEEQMEEVVRVIAGCLR
jgi:dTDP-4-amino-4,6-dideoxygalactose transaminase